MSGICGLLNLNAAPAREHDIRAMVAMMHRRGPAAQHRWRTEAIALGHTLLPTTPQSAIETLPFQHASSGCVITADIRLDNRVELLKSLGLADREDATGDAALALQAYLVYGEDCPSHLLGDFAFAIWDPRTNSLFCARDHFGMRPFYYSHRPDHEFAFASEPRSILVLPQIPYELSAARIADFLVEELQWIDFTSTFFEGVYRLPPGHQLKVGQGCFKLSEYWHPHPVAGPTYANDDEYREAFIEVFTRAVETRLEPDPIKVASMLSGGMDSGSVAATAADLLRSKHREPLSTYSALTRLDSARFPERELSESRAILAAVGMPGIQPNLVYSDTLSGDFETLLARIDEPFDGDFMFMQALFLAANQRGETVMLDGAGGDVILSEGTYITRLLRSLNFTHAIREIAAEPHYRCYGSFLTSLAPYLRAAITPNLLRQSLRGPRLKLRADNALRNSLLSPELAAAVNLDQRFARMQQTMNGGWRDDYFAERSNVIRYSMTAGRERYGRLAANMGLECRDPYLDRRFVDFCSTLPARFRLRDGWPKIILRDVMSEKLPAEVLWCRGKPHIGWLFNEEIARTAAAKGALSLERLTGDLATYVDPKRLRKAWHSFETGGDSGQIHQAFVLAVWLAQNALRPTETGAR